ncbi:hypothetical protein BSU04_01730 [Caballeronia sordidicola]|uniref:Uncharacterized protein n=1 Tax=Caballeronia sordidicola TaxID=196367 RepID=A0A226XCB1_CABSO|nr:hypothetical protein BSU04_01730 [Caballeronia sordidicola]
MGTETEPATPGGTGTTFAASGSGLEFARASRAVWATRLGGDELPI